ncbi:MAG: TonB family protein [Amaricoccus sp.]
MRVGALLSAAAHAGAIALALWALPWFRVRPEPPEPAVRVRLVSPGELAALSPPPAVPIAAPEPAAPAPPVAVAPPLLEDLIPPEEPDLAPGFDADAPLGIAAEGAPAPEADAAGPAFGSPFDPSEPAGRPARDALAPSVFGAAPPRAPSPFLSPEEAAPVEVIVQPDLAAPEAAPSPTQLARSTPPPRRPGGGAEAAPPEPAPMPAASDPAVAERERFQAAVAAAIERARASPAAGERAVGAARLEVSVARDGRLLQARLLVSSGSPLLDRAALAAARQAELPPAPADLPGESFRFEIGVSNPSPDR